MYRIRHKYKKKVIVPLVAISDNFKFLFDKDDRFITTSDGIRARVVDCVEKHIVELEQDIQELYGMNAWDFLKTWYNTDSGMISGNFLKLLLKQL